MQIKHIILIIFFCTPINSNGEITFRSGNNTITAQRKDIIDAAVGHSIITNQYIVHIEFTPAFGQNLFLFSIKNMGKQLMITTYGIQIGQQKKIKYNYTDRVKIVDVKKEEAYLLIKNIKEPKQQ